MAKPLKVEFQFDFGSPNAYLAERVIPVIEKRTGVAQRDDVKKRLIDLTTDAVPRGAFGSPTFFIGEEMFFGKDQLRDVEQSIVEQTAQRRRLAATAGQANDGDRQTRENVHARSTQRRSRA